MANIFNFNAIARLPTFNRIQRRPLAFIPNFSKNRGFKLFEDKNEAIKRNFSKIVT